jgi:hypothetical protein
MFGFAPQGSPRVDKGSDAVLGFFLLGRYPKDRIFLSASAATSYATTHSVFSRVRPPSPGALAGDRSDDRLILCHHPSSVLVVMTERLSRAACFFVS